MGILRNIFLTLIITPVAAILLLCIFMMVVFGPPSFYNTNFADTLVLDIDIEKYYDHAALAKTVEIDEADFARIKQMFGNGIAWYDSPGCSFADVSLVFTGSGKTFRIFPASDGCNLYAFGRKPYYFSIDGGDHEELQAILEKHGITWPV